MAIYTCVLLDVDNTLLDFDAAERQALTDMLTEYDLPHDAAACETYHAVNRELWDALAKGQLTRKRLFQVRFSRFMQAVGVPDNGKGAAMNDRYEELLSTHADLMPGALTALEELGEVATLAIVSNGSISVQEPRIAASGIDRFMDGIYISEKIGAAKPSAKFFEYALRDLGITNRRRVLVVGDDLLADIKEAFDSGDATEYEILKAYKTVDLLIVDDLGKEQCTEWSVSTLYSILNDRYEDMKPTIITTNYNADELVRALTPKGGDGTKARAIISRLREVSTVITMAWADYRAGGGRRNA